MQCGGRAADGLAVAGASGWQPVGVSFTHLPEDVAWAPVWSQVSHVVGGW